MRTILIAFPLCLASLSAISATAQEKPPPPKTGLGFDASKVPPPDPKRGKPVARVLDQYLYLDQVGGKFPRDDAEAKSKIRGLIGPLLHRFVEREKIVATPDEIDQAADYIRKGYEKFVAEGVLSEISNEDEEEAKRASRLIAEDFVVQWKYCRALYERYGGPVIFQQGNPLEPVGAYRRFLEDAERTGALEIYHPEDRQAFYDYFTRDHGHWAVRKDMINYDKPWWARTEKEKSNSPRPSAQEEKPNQQKATKPTK